MRFGPKHWGLDPNLTKWCWKAVMTISTGDSFWDSEPSTSGGISSHTYFVSKILLVVSPLSGQVTTIPKPELFWTFWVDFPYYTTIWGDLGGGKAAIIWRGLYFVYDTKNGQQIPSESAWERVLDFESHEVMVWMVCYDFCGFSSHAIHGEISENVSVSAKTTNLNMQVFWLTRWGSFLRSLGLLASFILFSFLKFGLELQKETFNIFDHPSDMIFLLLVGIYYLCNVNNVNTILQEVKSTWHSSYVLI